MPDLPLLRRLAAKHPASAAEAVLLRAADSRAELETSLRSATLEARRRFDPTASLLEELQVRLMGARANGALEVQMADDLLEPLAEAVSALAESEVELELAGVSEGSTVLHLRPRGAVAAEVDGVPVDSSSGDAALGAFISLLVGLDDGEDVRRHPVALRALSRLYSGLERYQLGAEYAWYARDGRYREATLSGEGRERLDELTRTVEKTSEKDISGHVVELRSSGWVKVKTVGSRRSPSYEVHFDDSEDLLALRWTLGDRVYMRIRTETEVDLTGEELKVKHFFKRMLGEHDKLV